MQRIALPMLAVQLLFGAIVSASPIAGFTPADYPGEQQRTWTTDSDVRILMTAPDSFDPKKPTLLILFALPNGSTIEMTIGSKLLPGMDWHYDIQHIAAQTRKLRQVEHERNIVVAYVEADAKTYKLTWPTWRKEKGEAGGKIIRGIVDEIANALAPARPQIDLVAHSGGGSFLFGYLNAADTIGENIERICWIDANYGYDDAEHHGDKLLTWLKGDPKRHLVVFAYNDRAATLNGKPFVSETGGTFYRSHKMVERFAKDVKLERLDREPFEGYTGMNGQIHLLLHTNPEKKILHTVLVERNGLLAAIMWDTPMQNQWGGQFWGERAYTDLVSSHTANLLGGKAFAESVTSMETKDREAAILKETAKGNIPDFQRNFVEVKVAGDGHQIVYQVIPDYLAIGNDADFIRMPMTPITAKKIADAFGCTLPTRKMVDDIYKQSVIKLEPHPMTEKREAMATFVEHSAIIEDQLKGKPQGQLVAGDKKDIVISNKLKEKPGKVAIYGWHKLDGKAIQPLYTGHGDFYADYSHGVRLVKNECVVDGKPSTIQAVLKDPELSKLLSDEGQVSGLFYAAAKPTSAPATTTAARASSGK
jgi:hypothetical protein